MSLPITALGSFCMLISFSASVSAQTDLSAPLPITEYGYPDFQGYWQNLHQTPLQRPVELGEKRAYSEEEAQALIQQARENLQKKEAPRDPDRGAPREARVTNQADDDFDEFPIDIAKVNDEYRTSLIVDPPDGRIPYVDISDVPEDEFFYHIVNKEIWFDGPEAAFGAERCLFPGPQLSMMYQRGLSPYAQIVQTKDYLMILGEYPYQARIIRIGGKHPTPDFPQWMGDSIARWEGDTLVIHTEKVRWEQSFRPIHNTVRTEIVERLSLAENDVILYEYTVTDPSLYKQPFTVQIPFTRMKPGEILYEYACHEGNYSFSGSLAGARREDVQREFDGDIAQ